MVAILHSNGKLRTDRDGDTEKGCQKPAVQQKTTDDCPFATSDYMNDTSERGATATTNDRLPL